MESIRKWFNKPKKGDRSLLAQFFFADEALNLVAAELDSFDGRKDPERCTALVNHLRQCQDKVLTICNRIMDEVIPFERADRDFRVKFPDDVMQENLAGQLWFGAECLAAGSSIMNREAESAGMRPLAKAVTKALEGVRNQLREQCLRGNSPSESEHLAESLKILDRLFAEFELCYVSAMVPVKTAREYQLHQLVVVLFSETLHRALQMRLLSQDMVDSYDPALMFTIPRLAIVSGLLVFPDSALCLDRGAHDMSEMFRPFRTLLIKIRELLWTLSRRELYTLEKMLCSVEAGDEVGGGAVDGYAAPDLDEFITRFYTDYPSCQQFVSECRTDAQPPAWLSSESESESDGDETEWAGEASESDTIRASDADRKSSLKLSLNAESSSPSSSDPPSAPADAHPPSPSPSIEIRSGFLLANKIGPSSVEESDEDPTPPVPPCAESLPDGDCREAMSVATATLSTLLGDSPGSPLDSGLGTGGDGGSLSEDRSPNREKQAGDIVIPVEKEPVASDRVTKSCTINKMKQSKSGELCRRGRSYSRGGRGYAGSWDRLLATQAGPRDTSSECSSCRSSDSSSETSSFNSECQDDEEIALAMQAAEIASRNEARSKFRSSEDLVHRLFVCLAGVADQLQTNFAGDLRHILKCVFLINNSATEEEEEPVGAVPDEEEEEPCVAEEALGWETAPEAPPPWVPDDLAPRCMACEAAFTVVRRRHHCRNCGKVFCARCSSNTVALPRYGHAKPVRVCNRCFLYQVTPFTIEQIAAAAQT